MVSRKINKKVREDVLSKVAKTVGMSKEETKKLVNNVLDAIVETVMETGFVSFPKFGIFEIRTQAAHQVRNPQNGDLSILPTRSKLFFRTNKFLREKIKNCIVKKE